MSDTGVRVVLGLAGMFLAFFVVWVVFRLRAWKTRPEKITEWARSQGMEFTAGPVDASGFASLSTLQRSESIISTEASNISRGTRAGLHVSVFDLLRGTRRQSGTRTYYSTLYGTFALFELRSTSLPWFEFSALSHAAAGSFEGGMLGAVTALAQLVGGDRGQDLIKLDGRPGLVLKGKDRAAVSALFSDATLEFFDQNLGWTLEGEGPYLLAGLQPRLRKGWRSPQIEELLAHQDLDRFLDIATTIAQRFRTANP